MGEPASPNFNQFGEPEYEANAPQVCQQSSRSLDAKDHSEKEDYQMKRLYEEKEREVAMLKERSLDAKDHFEKEDYQIKRLYEEKEREVAMLKESALNMNVNYGQEVANLQEELKQSNLRAQKLESENETLKRQPELQRARSNEQAIARLQEELRQLNLRHASISERRVRSDGRRTENTLSTNRQSELEQEYITDLKDGWRCDAIDIIMDAQKRNRKSDEKATIKAYWLACFIFQVAYHHATAVHDNFKAFSSHVLETLVNETPTIGIEKMFPQTRSSQRKQVQVQDALTEVLVLVKESATNHNLYKLYQVVKKTVDENWSVGKDKRLPSFDPYLFRDLESYIKQCTQFAWRMVTQLPPLGIDCSNPMYDPKEHIKSHAFSSSTKQLTSTNSTAPCEKMDIKCYLWPTLRDWDGRVIQRGEVIV